MSNKQHPILKMRRTLEKKHYLPRVIWPPQNQAIEADIARHVKPLLDALEIQHFENSGKPKRGWTPEGCPVCRLLAEWRRPL